ncbi:alkaline phytoceramidase [Achromobacter arsenitoxydans]|uniref:alkaline phytoceramidase n=1 Tax=Achromobacter arsenitoxydans TaxID=1147684 RepID=UPI00030102F5|nr:alkaline phytoceramidase [Achromobacter arsenitoxydans]
MSFQTAGKNASPGLRRVLPWTVMALVALAMALYGPIAQLEHYHDFADKRAWLGIPNACDVLSNAGFAVVGWYGLVLVRRSRHNPALDVIRPGYTVFFFALLLTAFGSGWYHLMPDNDRLIWDRLPIALLCAGILSAVWRETVGDGRWVDVFWTVLAVASVAWWRYTDNYATGDLRPYLFVQFMPLLLVPLLQWRNGTPLRERLYFGAAIGCYVLAKAAELLDYQIFQHVEYLSGHTLKHLASVLAGLIVTLNFAHRKREAGG